MAKNVKQVRKAEMSERNLLQEVTKILHEVGIPPHIKGYQYLRTAILLAIKDVTVMYRVTKVLYPMVAKMYDTTPSRVERAIRHAIELAWNNGNPEVLDSYFGYTVRSKQCKPTNSEFIAFISDELRLKFYI